MSQTELTALKHEVNHLKEDFQTKFEKIEAKIGRLEASLNQQTSNNEDNLEEDTYDLELDIDLELEKGPSPTTSDQTTQPSKATETTAVKVTAKTKTETGTETNLTPAFKSSPTTKTQVNRKPHTTHTHSQSSNQKKTNHQPRVSLIEKIPIGGLLGLATQLSAQLLKVYQHYKEQGKASIFFLTLGGITAFVGGFGYFLQYAFYHLFSNELKCSIGFFLGSLFILLGYHLMNKKSASKTLDWREYAAALVGLGLVINTLTLYYIGPYFQWLSLGATLLTLAMNACLGYYIAIRFETKIVATISLVGSLTTPLFFGLANLDLFSAVTYVFFISLGSATVAKKIHWQILPYFCLTLSILFLETHLLLSRSSIQSINLNNLAVIGMVILLFRHYFNWILESLSFKTQLNGLKVTLLVGNLVFTLGYFWQLLSAKSLCFLAFAIMAAVVLYLYRQHIKDKTQRTLTLMVASSIIAVAFLRVLDNEALALVWILEANLLLYLSLKQRLAGIRIECYCLYLFGTLQAIGVFIATIFNQPFSVFSATIAPEWGTTWWLLLGLMTGFSFTNKLLKQHFNQATQLDEKLISVFAEANSIAITIFIFITAAMLTPQWVWNWAPIPLLILLYRSRYQNLPVSEIIAWSMFLPLASLTIKAGIIFGDFYFSSQPWISRIARIELFALLYGVYYFYHHTHFYSNLRKFAFLSAELFFICLPICFIPSVWKHINQYISCFLWLSIAISVLIYWYRPKLYYQVFTLCLVGFSSLVSVLSYYFAYKGFWENPVLLLALISNASFACALFFEHRFRFQPLFKATNLSTDQSQFLKIIRQMAGIYFSLNLAAVVFYLTTDFLLALLSIQAFFTLTWWMLGTQWLQRDSLVTTYWGILISQVLLFLCAMDLRPSDTDSSWLVAVWLSASATFLGLVFYGPTTPTRLFRIYKKIPNISTWTHYYHQLTISLALHMSTHGLILSIEPIYFSVLLMTQAICMLFLSLNQRLIGLHKLANIYFAIISLKILILDLEGAGLTQRVIALMSLGIVLLGSAYLLQWVKARHYD